MVKFFKTNWPILFLALIATMVLGRILEFRKTELPLIKQLEREEENRYRPKRTTLPPEQEAETTQLPSSL